VGLPHTDDAGSVKCCASGTPLSDPAVRERYLAARRNPEVRSVVSWPERISSTSRFHSSFVSTWRLSVSPKI
jgi:hypothetical protein